MFSWKVGSEQNYDWLTWYLDGVQQGRISGSRDWELITKDLNGEEHVLRFVYSADNIISVTPDCGWVSVCASGMRSPTLRDMFPDSPVTSVTIGEEVTELPDGFFAECAEMELVVLPDVLVTIGRDAFSGCASLEDLTLPSSVANIGAKPNIIGLVVLFNGLYQNSNLPHGF